MNGKKAGGGIRRAVCTLLVACLAASCLVQPLKASAPPAAKDAESAKALMEANISFKSAVFSGKKFPEYDFRDPGKAKKWLGSYRLQAVFYNSAFRKVTAAAKPGRYGAIVKITPKTGRPFYRFVSLWRKAARADTEKSRKRTDNKIEAIGILAPGLAERLKKIVDRDNDPRLRAALRAASGERINTTVVADADDRQWWVTMKRRFYGPNKAYMKRFVSPRPIKGKAAPVLRNGTLAQAGMKPDADAKIDELLKAWAADSEEAFAVCIARHGIIVLHRGYGKRAGKPMTVNTKSWMASMTKLLCGTLMMMLVEQGVDLDDRVDKYLPAFGAAKVDTPLTIRHLYTHTNGLSGHWGDLLNDLEERVANYYPYLEVGKKHAYNGVGYALGGKIIEAVSGESLPAFYKKHLLGPLGCAGTTVADTSGGAWSVPMDIAKVAQMLLNRGAYGKMRFFSEKTFEKMLPVSLRDAVGLDSRLQWGVGTTWFRGNGLGKGTFGHGAASGATLRIDPQNDLLIVMTRNKWGRNYRKYHSKFIRTVAEAIAD